MAFVTGVCANYDAEMVASEVSWWGRWPKVTECMKNLATGEGMEEAKDTIMGAEKIASEVPKPEMPTPGEPGVEPPEVPPHTWK